jgi:cytosine deaminase
MPTLRFSDVRIPGSNELMNVEVTDARISAVGPGSGRSGSVIPAAGATAAGSSSSGDREIAGAGRLLVPAFVDAHFHLDSVLTRLPNASGTLREGIDNWGAYKASTLTVEDVVDRASRYCEHAFAQGIMAIRSHVDVSDPQLRTAEGLVEVKRRFADRIDIQLVAFPQDGFFGSSETPGRLERALDMGVDVVGGIPHNEPTYNDGSRSIAALIDIAERRGLMVDMHCDESDDPHSRHVETLAAETIARSMQGMVTASHITASATYDRYYLSRRLIPMMQRADLNVTTNPLINVHLGGHFSHPSHRAMAPIRDLHDAGLNVSTAQDCNEDPWYPIGNADMFEVARMAGHIAHLLGEDEFGILLEMITTAPARAMRLPDYGVHPGARANLVLLGADSVKEAIRTSASRDVLVRDGRVVSEG